MKKEIKAKIQEVRGVPLHKPEATEIPEPGVNTQKVGEVSDFDGKNKKDVFLHQLNTRLTDKQVVMLEAIRQDFAKRMAGLGFGEPGDQDVIRHLIEYRYLEMKGKVGPMEFK